MHDACASAPIARRLARVHKQMARSHKMRAALSSRRFGRLHLQSRRTRQNGRAPKMSGSTSALRGRLRTDCQASGRRPNDRRDAGNDGRTDGSHRGSRDSPIHARVILSTETAAGTFHEQPNFIARLFQLPDLQGGLLCHAETSAERRDQPLHLQKLQEDRAPVVWQPIQLHELDGTARQGQAAGRVFTMGARIRALSRHEGASGGNPFGPALSCSPATPVRPSTSGA